MLGFLSFDKPWYLIGMLAAAIPIVLHLLWRVRAPQLLFSTLRFLRISMEKTARRRKIQNWLLLALRALLFGLLAAAIAQPIFKSTNFQLGDEQLAAVFIIDNSMSMDVRSEKSTRFDRAKQAATQLLTDKPQPARQALLFTNGREAQVKPQWEANRREAVTRLAAAKTGIGRASLAPLLDQAAKLLAEVSLPNKAVYVVTDLQDITLRDLEKPDALAALADVPVMVVNTHEGQPHNVAVSDLRIGEEGRVAGSPVSIEAQIVNTGGTAEEVGVGLAIDDKVLSALSQTVRLEESGKPGSTTWVSFECTFNEPGWHGGQVFLMKPRPNVRSLTVIDPEAFAKSGDAWADSLTGDDQRYFAVFAVQRIRAVVVHPDKQEAGPRAADFFLKVALGIRGASIEAQAVPMSAFGPDTLKDADIVFCCDVPAPAQTIGQLLEGFVKGGGTLAIFLGPNYVPDDYNKALGGVLPGRLGEALGRTDQKGKGWKLQSVDAQHPLLAQLYDNASAYQMVLAWRYVRIDLDPAAKPEVVARFENEDPLLVSRDLGAGRVYLTTTSANTAWSDLPTTPLFVPVVIRMCLRSAGAGPQVPSAAENTAVSLSLSSAGVQQVEVRPPKASGAAAPLVVASKPEGGGNTAVFAETAWPGVYRWQTVGPQPQQGAFVVNPDSDESNLAMIDKAAIPSRILVADSGEELARLVEQQRKGSPLWDYVLFIVLLFAVLECLLANRNRPTEQTSSKAETPPVGVSARP